MEWIERRDGDWLVNEDGKVMGRVFQTIGGTLHHSETIYAGGGNHKNPLGDYISSASARAAVERHIGRVLLGDEKPMTPDTTKAEASTGAMAPTPTDKRIVSITMGYMISWQDDDIVRFARAVLKDAGIAPAGAEGGV